MTDIVQTIILAPLGILLYDSGLLLWPFRRWRHRGRKFRARALWYVFLAQIFSYLVVAICSIFIHLHHFYYWFIFLIQLNIVFTVAGLFMWRRDRLYERLLAGMVASNHAL
jgi:hypothetical protein